MSSRLLALAFALLLLPAPALAGVKEKVAAMAPTALVYVVDDKGTELIAQAPDALVTQLNASPNEFLLHRHRHRRRPEAPGAGEAHPRRSTGECSASFTAIERQLESVKSVYSVCACRSLQRSAVAGHLGFIADI